MTESAREPVKAFDPERYIGVVSQIHPASVKINLHTTYTEDEFGGSDAVSLGEVGEYVLIPVGRIVIFGQITDIKTETVTSGSNGQTSYISVPVAEVALLSSINTEENSVAPGIQSSARIGHKVYSAAPEVVQLVVEARHRFSKEDQPVLLNYARLPNAIGSPLSFTPEMLFGRHLALLGATGGGKSWSVARLVEECARYRCKVVLFDATGEYYRLNPETTTHVHLGADPNPPAGSREVALPYFHLKESDLFAIFKPSGQSQAPKLRAAIKSLKLARLDPALALDGVILKAHKSKEHYEAAYKHFVTTIESPTADFDVRKLTRQIENECVKANRSALEPNFWGDLSGIDQANCIPLINRISDIIQSPNLAPIFDPRGKTSLLEELDTFLEDSTARVFCMSLKYLSFAHSAREIVANATGRYLLELARENRFRGAPMLIVVDEAHQFLNEHVLDEHGSFPLDSFAIIAKEGRKYGLNICLATQRPRDIPEGVLSQMGTLIVHRLINDRDRAVVERASGEMDRSSLATLPSLAPGEAVIVGVDFPIPLSVKVERPTAEPDSKGPNYQKHWE